MAFYFIMSIFLLWISTVLCAPASGGPYVSFSAGLTSTQYMMDGDTVMYDKIFVNEHNGYDKNKGIFTCPVSGLYILHFHGYSTNKDTIMWLEMTHNDQPVVSVSGFNSHTVGSNTVMLQLRQGDRVQIKSKERQQFALFGLDDQVYSTFTGYLVHEINGSFMDSGAGSLVG